MITAATLLLPGLGQWKAGAIALLIVWGVAYGAVPVSSQTWFTKATPDTPEAASVMAGQHLTNTASFNPG